MPDILVTENISGAAMEKLRGSFSVAFEPELWKSPDALKRRIGEFIALIVRNQTKVDAELMDAASKLQVIGRAGVGLDNVDVDAASARGIVVCFTPEQNSLSVAELTLGLMLSLARRIPQANNSAHQGKWERQNFTGVELFGKTLGLIGLGRIGSLAAARASAFGMDILVHDPQMRPDSLPVIHSRATLVSLDDLLSLSDYVSIHVPETRQTKNLLNDQRLARMKPTAFLINTSRGGVIEEAALIRALREKKIAGAALDVRATEPPAPSELEQMDNVILLPHIAAFTDEGQRRVVECVCTDVAAVLRGEPARSFVNFARPKRETT
jgi:D-3-phosphoglycerate dehydrogenase